MKRLAAGVLKGKEKPQSDYASAKSKARLAKMKALEVSRQQYVLSTRRRHA